MDSLKPPDDFDDGSLPSEIDVRIASINKAWMNVQARLDRIWRNSMIQFSMRVKVRIRWEHIVRLLTCALLLTL